ncbi:MAG TPA: hypothetical protein VFU43_02985 [Streptosporangiaceae bacterium]|nr:hypothetical protein [Streptosporangiaceae bacterium]
MIEGTALFPALCSAVAIGGGVAILALSLAAKVADWGETRMLWPVTGAARRIAGPGPVTTVEGLVVGAALVPALPVALRLGTIGLLYAAYAPIALRLRGRRCACFGGWLPTRFTAGHAAVCAGVAVLAAGGLLDTRSGRWLASVEAATGIVLAALGMLATLAVAKLRRHASARGARRAVDHIVIFTTEDCGFCAALEAQRGRFEAMTDRPVEFRRADSDDDVRAAGGTFPAAVPYGADGRPVDAAAHGLAGIRDLLHRSASAKARVPA